MVKGKISCGFEFEINENELDDMEFLDALAETKKDPLAFSIVCEKLLGIEQRARLYDHLRNENGRVPIKAMEDAVGEIMNSAGEQVKNS